MSLFIDADACPVKAEAEKVATRHRVTMYVVSNGGLRPSQNPLVENIIVDAGPDVADMWIADRCGPADVVVTGDIPLAAKCVEKGARVVKHNGEVLHGTNIGMALAFRLSVKLGLCPGQDAERFTRHLQAVGLPSAIGDIPGARPGADDLIGHMAHDKKVADGKLTFILLRGLGQAFVTNDVPLDAVKSVLTDG